MDCRAGWIAALAGALALAAGAAMASPTAIALPRAPSLLPVLPGPAPAPPPGAVIVTPAALAALSPEARAAIRELMDISQSLRAGLVGDAAARLRPLLATPAYFELPPRMRQVGYAMLADLDLRAGRLDEAQLMIVQATTLAGATAEEWELQVNIALARGDARGQILALTALAQAFPAAVPGLQGQVIAIILARARALPDGADLRFKLGQALLTAKWTPELPFGDPSVFILAQVAMLIDHGDLAGARGVIGLVDNPVAMIGPAADRRFDPIRATDPQAFDLAALSDKSLQAASAAAEAAPGLLARVRDRADALVLLGRHEEALRLLDPALAKAPTYTDADAQRASSETVRARALVGLGRYDEALAQMIQAANRPEDGHANIAQRLALAQLQVEMGRAKEGLASLDAVPAANLSMTGRTNVESLRACADGLLGDRAAMQASLAFVRAHAPAAPGALRDALACAGDLDGAAQTLIAALNDPDQRLAALAWAQTLKRPPAPPGPHPSAQDRRTALLARPDVKAAIDKVGRVATAPIYMSEF